MQKDDFLMCEHLKRDVTSDKRRNKKRSIILMIILSVGGLFLWVRKK